MLFTHVHNHMTLRSHDISTLWNVCIYHIYKLDVESRKLRALESRRGPGL